MSCKLDNPAHSQQQAPCLSRWAHRYEMPHWSEIEFLASPMALPQHNLSRAGLRIVCKAWWNTCAAPSRSFWPLKSVSTWSERYRLAPAHPQAGHIPTSPKRTPCARLAKLGNAWMTTPRLVDQPKGEHDSNFASIPSPGVRAKSGQSNATTTMSPAGEPQRALINMSHLGTSAEPTSRRASGVAQTPNGGEILSPQSTGMGSHESWYRPAEG